MEKKLLVLGLAVLMLASCSSAPVQEATLDNAAGSEDISAVDLLENGPSSELTSENQFSEELIESNSIDAENAGIIFMREEEKLARDVYLQLAELWGMNIFSNITRSEDTHMDAVLTLIDMKGLADPVLGMEVGEFQDQELQTLYNELVARGSESLADALLVGAAIEEIDILDLQKFLAETEDESISEVYQNLLKGSINHLQSFVRTYERQTGEQYLPQYLTEEAFQELLSMASSRGNGAGQGRGAQPEGQGQGQAD